MYAANVDQDWDVVKFKSKTSSKGPTEVVKKDVSSTSSQQKGKTTASNKPAWKVENTIDSALSGESNKPPITHVSKLDAQAIIKARTSMIPKPMNQQELAHAMNMNSKYISDIESCKAVENLKDLGKIKRFLKITAK